MANLAIAISKKNSYLVTGSDTEISESALLPLKENKLMPDQNGWFTDKIHKGLFAVITGTGITEDNPEYKRAKEIGLRIFSYPEFLYLQTRSKTRIVVSGSSGRSAIIAMILYVLQKQKIDTDYAIECQQPGIGNCVRLTYDARVAVLDGDENFASPFDLRPKFHIYKPHIAVITGIKWNHNDIFPTAEIYAEQYNKFIELMEIQGRLIYFNGDEYLCEIATKLRRDIVTFDYNTPEHEIKEGIIYLNTKKGSIPLKISGEHNLQNMNAARLACKQVGVTDDQFYNSIVDFDML